MHFKVRVAQREFRGLESSKEFGKGSGSSKDARRAALLHQAFLTKGFFEHVALQQTVEQTVAGLGYDLVEIERSAGGLLRVTIDIPWSGPNSEAGAGELPEPQVTVEDCEKVTRQLQFALEVDGAEYKRLEVSSPGIDRPLRNEQDFERFAGQVIDITLKAPMGTAAAGQVSASRKKFRGTLERVAGAEGAESAEGAQGSAGWQIVWSDAPEPKPGQKISKKRAPAPLQALGFSLDELREARLAPIVDFKGRRPKPDTPVSD
ncbi:Ribosome maturation factor RimP [Burkholderiales bacterium 8X]|nr:Ribosome maturation factor RimP [Burkholderiales bacterium 8X]